MGKDLVIVESPQKARTITRILGDDYAVMASMGHVRDLPEKGLGVDLDHDFKPEYQPTPSRRKVIVGLQAAAKHANQVYLATDPDREGEAISWHLFELLKSRVDPARFHRVTFHEITRPAVEHAFQHPGQLDLNVVNAQQARRVLDRLVGYQVSPLLWKRVEPGTSAGRVQSVALRLLCERQEAIDRFQPQEYWLLTAAFEKTATREPFQARLVRLDGVPVRIPRGGIAGAQAQARAAAAGGEDDAGETGVLIGSADLAETYARDAQSAAYAVASVTHQPRARHPQPPFITSTLQQAASANLGFSPDQTMRLAQALYEGAEINGESAGLITYMRTDSVNVSPLAQTAAREFVGRQFGPAFVPAKPNVYRSRGTAQEAHEAIRPTDVTLTPDRVKASLDERQHQLYTLIWNRFVASQMTSAQLSLYTVELASRENSAQHQYVFRATATSVVFPGYMRVYDLQDVKDDRPADEPEAPLPALAVPDPCTLTGLDRQQKQTEPPPRFSEAMLVRELEQNGVGRPSTYAAIIDTLKVRKYVTKVKGKLTPTPLGQAVHAFLRQNFPTLFQVDFTAHMEGLLDAVESGKADWVATLREFYSRFTGWLEAAGAKSAAPTADIITPLLALFPADLEWAPADKRGRRTYDDGKFHRSLTTQIEKGKRLSDRQWQALLNLIHRYAARLPAATATIERLGLAKDYAAVAAETAARAALVPDAQTLKLASLVRHITQWVPPQGKSNRDDQRFCESLLEQAQRRPLSERQLQALKSVLSRYHEQLPDYAALQTEFGLLPPQAAPEPGAVAATTKLLALLGEIKTWQPVAGSGRRRYNDQAFVDSVRRQWQTRHHLSPRQVAALARVLQKYRDQIPDFAARWQDVGLKLPEKEPAETTVVCPGCGQAKLARKHFRGRTFYGCQSYPTCKFTVSSLDRLPPPTAPAAAATAP